MRTGAVTVAAAALTTLMVGCAGPSQDPGEALAGACQFKPCVCADEDAPFWRVPDTAEIIWNEDGRPSCPPGFALQRKAEGG
ncbi:MAG: hypothetical protein MUD06_05475 [Rhodospirillales bacterium]|jgi:hypothetical protein|nr:hypothetical protein [Rhodospirillales bacterium]